MRTGAPIADESPELVDPIKAVIQCGQSHMSSARPDAKDSVTSTDPPGSQHDDAMTPPVDPQAMPPAAARPHSRQVRWLWIATAVAGLVLAVVTFTAPRGLFSGDEGIKLVQALGVLDHGFSDPYLPYPGRAFDPAERNYPFSAPFVVEHGGHHHGIYPITFVAPSAAGWAAFGFWGLHLVPLACGIWVVYLTLILAHRATGDLRWSIAAAALLVVATPFVLQTALFNEHVPGIAFLLAGLVGLVDPTEGSGPRRTGGADKVSPPRRLTSLIDARSLRLRSLLAGAALGLAATLRSELMAAAPAVVVFVAVTCDRRTAVSRLAVAAAAAAAVMGAYVLYNLHVTGHLLPTVIANLERDRPTRGQMLPLLFDPAVRGAAVPVLAAAAATGLVALWPRVPRRWVVAAAAVLTIAWCGVAGYALAGIPSGGAIRQTHGLFGTTPLLVLGLYAGLAGPPPASARFARACMLTAMTLALAVFATDMDRDAGGLQLGTRHMLGAVPLLVVSAVSVLAGLPRRALAVAVVPLALSIWANTINYRVLRKIAGRNEQLVAAIQHSPARDVVTSFWWGPQVLAPLWPTHRVYRGGDAALLGRLRDGGIAEVVQALGGLEHATGVREESAQLRREGVITYRFVDAQTPTR